MPRKTKADAELTKQSIVESAIDVFYEKGVVSSNIQDIVERSGVTRGAFYWHFKNKAEILEHLILHLVSDLNKFEEESFEDPILALKYSGVSILSYFLQNDISQRIYTIFLQKTEFNNELESLYELCSKYDNEQKDYYRELFKQASDIGIIQSRLTPKLLAFGYFAYIGGILSEISFYKEVVDQSEITNSVEDLIAHFFEGILITSD